jgi:quinol monooxygenase YgiN
MILMSGSLSFDPADREEVIAELRLVMAASRQDGGCIEYAWSQDLENPATFRFVECWDNQAHLDAHLATRHVAAFNDRVLRRITDATATEYAAITA